MFRQLNHQQFDACIGWRWRRDMEYHVMRFLYMPTTSQMFGHRERWYCCGSVGGIETLEEWFRGAKRSIMASMRGLEETDGGMFKEITVLSTRCHERGDRWLLPNFRSRVSAKFQFFCYQQWFMTPTFRSPIIISRVDFVIGEWDNSAILLARDWSPDVTAQGQTSHQAIMATR